MKKLVDTLRPTDDNYPTLPTDFIKKMLDAEDKVPEKHRAGTYTTHVHVSSLASGKFCPRQYAIAVKEDLALHESLTGGHKVTFRLGRAAETHVREGFMNRYGVEKVYADWRCDCERTRWEGLHRKAVCQHCNTPLDNFNEPDLIDDENGVKGHSDLIFLYEDTHFIQEIKSINLKDFKELTEPLPTALLQAGMYPDLLRAKGLKVSPIVVFTYVGKEFVWGSPYKEFHVDTSTPEFQARLDDLRAEARKLKDYVERDISPERVCPSINSTLAKSCPVSFRCFYSYEDTI